MILPSSNNGLPLFLNQKAECFFIYCYIYPSYFHFIIKNYLCKFLYWRPTEHIAHFHIIKFLVNLLHFFSCQGDVGSTDILLQAAEASCTGDGYNPRTLAKHPCEGDLRRRGMMFFGKTVKQGEQVTVLLETLFAELWHGSTVIRS